MKIFLLILIFSSQALATKPTLSPLMQVQRIFAKYWASDSVFMQVEKQNVMGLLGRTTKSEGRLLFSKGKLRIDFLKPTPTTIIFNSKKITIMKQIKQGKTNKRFITYFDKARVERQNALMGLLFGDKNVWSKLKLKKANNNGDLFEMIFLPKQKDIIPGIEKVAIVIDQSTREIQQVKQWDDSENEVRFIFSSMLFDIPFVKDYFTIKTLPTDEISEIK